MKPKGERVELGAVLAGSFFVLLGHAAMGYFVFGVGLNDLGFLAALVSVGICAWATVTGQLQKRILRMSAAGFSVALIIVFTVKLNEAGVEAVVALMIASLSLPLNYVALICFSIMIRRGIIKWTAK